MHPSALGLPFAIPAEEYESARVKLKFFAFRKGPHYMLSKEERTLQQQFEGGAVQVIQGKIKPDRNRGAGGRASQQAGRPTGTDKMACAGRAATGLASACPWQLGAMPLTSQWRLLRGRVGVLQASIQTLLMCKPSVRAALSACPLP